MEVKEQMQVFWENLINCWIGKQALFKTKKWMVATANQFFSIQSVKIFMNNNFFLRNISVIFGLVMPNAWIMHFGMAKLFMDIFHFELKKITVFSNGNSCSALLYTIKSNEMQEHLDKCLMKAILKKLNLIWYAMIVSKYSLN